jgi:beta-mannanase
MNNKRIYQIASLIMTLVVILGNTVQSQAAPPAATTAPSIYWGALVEGKAPDSTNMAGVFATFETLSKKKMSIIHWGEPWMMKDGSWGEFQTTYFNNVRNHGSIPMLNWSSHQLGTGANQPNFQLRDITAGTYDTYIRRWATAAKNWGHPFFLYFNPEMNGWWYPWSEGKLADGTIVNGNSSGDYVKAWRHVHDIFTSVGANNVSWVWGPNYMSTSTRYPALSTLYPGGAYVDWTALSVYNRGSTWMTFNQNMTGNGFTWMKNSYNEVLKVAPYKPMMLAQWGSIEAGDGGTKKAAWLKDALINQVPTNFPKVKALIYFNWNAPNGESFPIQSSQAATAAWAAGIAMAKYAPNQFANFNTSPIPALASSSTTGTSAILETSSTEASATLEASPTVTPIVDSPTASPTTIPASPAVTATTVLANADSFIDDANPESAAGGVSKTLYVNASPVQTTFLKFDLTSLTGKTISTVTLKFKTTSDADAGSGNSSNVKLVNDVLWKEQYLSFSNTVAISETVLGTVPSNSVPNTWYEITLEPSAIQPNAGQSLSMAIESTGPDGLLFYSREATDQPQLVITYK